MCEGCPIESGMTTERSEIPDQVAEDGVMFLDEVLHDLGIDRCLPDIFGQCVGSYPTGILLGVGVFI